MKSRLDQMEKIFSPRSVAFVGASNNLGKWGGIIFGNLMGGGYAGKVFPVNPREETVQGLRAYRSVSEVPGEVDLAIFTIPAAAMPEAIDECVKKKIPAGVVVTAGFGELGPAGRELEAEMVRRARAGGMVLVGPNGQGISVPASKLHPWMPLFKPAPGRIGIASQSGNVCTALAEQLSEFGFGCSKVISAGNCGDLGFPDYLDYLCRDPDTGVILLYVEGVGDGREFFTAARRAALEKPVVVVKSGATAAGGLAASTHTGAMAGFDAVFDAAARQAGVVRARTLEEAVVLAAAFVNTPLPAGPRVGMVTGGGGFGVLAADAASRLGLVLSRFSDQTVAQLQAHLPTWWSPNNPVDMVAGLGFGGPRELVPILMESGEVDGVILLGIGWLYSMLDPVDGTINFRDVKDDELRRKLASDEKYCVTIAECLSKWGKPLLITSSVARLASRRGYPGLLRLIEAGAMLYPAIDDAVGAFAALSERRAFLARESGLAKPGPAEGT